MGTAGLKMMGRGAAKRSLEDFILALRSLAFVVSQSSLPIGENCSCEASLKAVIAAVGNRGRTAVGVTLATFISSYVSPKAPSGARKASDEFFLVHLEKPAWRMRAITGRSSVP